MKLSVVATLFRSAPYIDDFYQRVSTVARNFAGDAYEIILVNDGSPDRSLELAVKLTEMDNHVVVVDLSRNFGHHKAMMAGLAHSVGEHVFLIDSDLEEQPEWLVEFSGRMELEKCDVVFGVQDKRKGNWFERWSGELHYSIFSLLVNIEHPRNITTARLMTRRYVNALLLHEEREVVISGLWVIAGFEQKAHTVTKQSNSASTYSLIPKLSHLVNIITSFSSKPLIGIFFTGIFIFIISVISAFVLIYHRLFLSRPMDGWTSIMVSIWLLGGITISFIGIIGIYLSKIFSETKKRPYFIVRDIYGKAKN